MVTVDLCPASWRYTKVSLTDEDSKDQTFGFDFIFGPDSQQEQATPGGRRGSHPSYGASVVPAQDRNAGKHPENDLIRTL